MESKYYKNLNIIRIIAVIAVLLYHLNILKGGFLAVSIFFILSSYLSCLSFFKKEKFSLWKYYKNLIIKLYIPLVIVVFTTILVLSYIPNFVWINIKPETKSVLLLFNNFWQLSNNLNYFTKSMTSPFTHFWYISILLEFDLICPFIYLFLKKIGDKINHILPIIITLIISILSTIYFYYCSFNSNIMYSYYNTFSRMFSLWFGICLSLIHIYYGPLIIKKFRETSISKFIFSIYSLLLVLLFIFVSYSSKYYALSMLLVNFITLRLIEYAIIDTTSDNIFYKLIKKLSSISYEVYLLQIPLIIIMSNFITNKYLNISIILLLFILSFILHFALTKYKNLKVNILRYICLILFGIASLLGIYKYYVTEDYTIEMKSLEKELEKNSIELLKKQEEYNKRVVTENRTWEQELNSLTMSEEDLKNMVTNLSITGVGDSVMLGAIDNLYDTFKNSYFDAKISRTAWGLNDILLELKNKNILGDVIILNLGANGDCSLNCKKKIMETCEGKEVFWLNTTNLISVNDTLNNFAKDYDNLHIIDWYNISLNHKEYFYADGIHLTGKGRVFYTNAIYDAIYDFYLKKYEEIKENKINEHNIILKNKITFMGSELLLNAFPYLNTYYNNSKYLINKDYNIDTIIKDLNDGLKNNTLTYKVVLVFDSLTHLNIKDYKKILNLLKNKEVYIVSLTDIDLKSLNAKIIDFKKEIYIHEDYLLVDKIHLSSIGNDALVKYLISNLNN